MSPHPGGASNPPSAESANHRAGLIGNGLDFEAPGPLSTLPALPHPGICRLDMLPEAARVEQPLGLAVGKLLAKPAKLCRMADEMQRATLVLLERGSDQLLQR